MTEATRRQKPSIISRCASWTRARDVRALGLYPYFKPVERSEATRVTVEGQELLMIGSNNYLGLTHHPDVKAAAEQAVREFGTSCTGSRYLNGTLRLHEQLEERLAKFTGHDGAIVYSTGFQANQGLLSTLCGKDDVIFADRENHASLVDGCRLSFAKTKKFAHNDMAHLRECLASTNAEGKLIVVDGVFSMTGELAPLPEICALAAEFGAAVMVDDAHAFGVLGPGGTGTAAHFGVQDGVDIVMGTFSKSFASLGGFIAGSAEMIEFVKHHSRALIFSASIPPANAAAALAALEIIEREPWRQERVHAIANRVKTELRAAGFDVPQTDTPIVPVVVGEFLPLMKFWRALFDAGLFTNPVMEPAVPADQCMIRTSYMATHTDDDITEVIDTFVRVGRAHDLIG
jgi:8-amino-7-oxononanoate synthase